jgi:hypothetical protein
MTIISTVITRHYTAHASDSFLTELKPGGTLEVKEAQKPKLVFVQHWRGALAFWGLAIKGHWSTLDWLRQRAGQASNYVSPEEFANELSADLSSELSRQTFVKDTDKGIGIHFTAYEHIDEYWIPELFLVSNFTDPSYTAVQNVVGVSRQTYSTLKKIPPVPEHRNRSLRMEVQQALLGETMFLYNNGDPVLFNEAANSVGNVFRELMKRGILDEPSSRRTHCALARRPIEIISKLLVDFSEKGKRAIGGKPHDLCVSPGGDCWSTTGDCTR